MVILVAVLKKDNKVLIAKKNGKWGLPGIKKYIMDEDILGIQRLLMAEFGIEASVDKYLGSATFEYKGEVMIIKSYIISSWLGTILLDNDQEIAWIVKEDARYYRLHPLDKEILKLL